MADSFFFSSISQPIVRIVRVIEKSHSTSNGMWPLVLIGAEEITVSV